MAPGFRSLADSLLLGIEERQGHTGCNGGGGALLMQGGRKVPETACVSRTPLAANLLTRPHFLLSTTFRYHQIIKPLGD